MSKQPIDTESVEFAAMQSMVEKLSTAADRREDDNSEVLDARMKARRGDCEPLIRIMWPSLIVDEDHADYKHLGRGVRLDDFQMKIINGMVGREAPEPISEIAVKGCTSAGKGCSIGIGAVIAYYLYPDANIVITSTSHDHAKRVLFGEVRRWARSSMLPIEGKILKETIDGGEQHFIKVVNPESEEGFSGTHSTCVIIVFDEATAVAQARYDLALTQAHCIVAAANPRTLGGWFRNMFPASNPDETQIIDGELGKRLLVTVDGRNVCNVRAGYDVIPGQMDRTRLRALENKPDPRFVAMFAHGKFPDEDPDKQIIFYAWIERAEAAHHQDLPVTSFGFDIGASITGDPSILAAGGSEGCRDLHEKIETDLMKQVEWILAVARDIYGIELLHGQNPIALDRDGLGKGVADRLSELNVWVVEHIGNATSTVDARTYGNMRAETFGELGKRMNPLLAPDVPWAVPSDPLLREELTAIEKIFGLDSIKYHVTPKEIKKKKRRGDEVSLKDKLGRSPDRCDAVGFLWLAQRQVEEYEYGDTSGLAVGYGGEDQKLYRDLTPAERDEAAAQMNPEVKSLMDFLTKPRQFGATGRRSHAVAEYDTDEDWLY